VALDTDTTAAGETIAAPGEAGTTTFSGDAVAVDTPIGAVAVGGRVVAEGKGAALAPPVVGRLTRVEFPTFRLPWSGYVDTGIAVIEGAVGPCANLRLIGDGVAGTRGDVEIYATQAASRASLVGGGSETTIDATAGQAGLAVSAPSPDVPAGLVAGLMVAPQAGAVPGAAVLRLTDTFDGQVYRVRVYNGTLEVNPE
jgi:hypothetical protein